MFQKISRSIGTLSVEIPFLGIIRCMTVKVITTE